MRTRFLLWILALLFLSPLLAIDGVDSRKKNGAKNGEMDTKKVEINQSRDTRFALVKELKLTVPTTYDHKTQLGNFENENKNSTEQVVTESFSSRVFTTSAHELVPGKTYTVRIFSFSTDVSYDDCREFMIRGNVKYVGAPGLSLLCQMKRDAFPKEKIVLAFGDFDVAIPHNETENIIALPVVAALKNKQVGTAFLFTVLKISKEFNTNFCILCFYDD